MRDFTKNMYRSLLNTLLNSDYCFQTLEEFIENPAEKVFLLRHDVDKAPLNSLEIAQLEHQLGIRGSYYFRIVPDSYDKNIIQKIADLNHEIGYHYEDVRLAAKQNGNGRDCFSSTRLSKEHLLETAIVLFEKHLRKMRQFYPVRTIVMHGNPLSKYDNRILWEKYDFREFGIIGEPYFNSEFEDIEYLTDTGRRWNGQHVNLRDRFCKQNNQHSSLDRLNIKKTTDIIRLLQCNEISGKLMITIHPQRWHNSYLGWSKELLWQNIKNLGKWSLSKFRKYQQSRLNLNSQSEKQGG